MNKVILLVEDEIELREILARTLKSEGYDVVEATDGNEAVNYLRDRDTARPNMMLLDLMLPGMNGWALRAELLKDPLLARIPVVILSGTANVPQTAANMRAAAYLEKPFRLEQFVHVVENHLPVLEDQLAEDAAVLQTMSDAVGRLTHLIEEILQSGTFQDDRLVATATIVDLPALATEILDELRPQAMSKDIDLKMICSEEIPTFKGDPEILRLIIASLVTSAVDALEFGAVDLLCSHDAGGVHIGVRELGKHERFADPIAEPAASLEERSETMQKRKSAPGVGLALSLVRELLTGIQGSIELQSDPEGASIFTLSIKTPQGSNRPLD